MPDEVSISEIEEGLYLGNFAAAMDLGTLKKNRISHILTIESSHLPDYIKNIPGMRFLHIFANDLPHEDLLSQFPQMTDFIFDGQTKGNVLVHCFHGMSRSSTGVIAFLMKKYNIPYNVAFERAKAKRKFVYPNSGFQEQLILYEKMHYKLNTTNIVYKLYRLKVASENFKCGNFVKDKFEDIITEKVNNTAQKVIKCKACRVVLFSHDDIIYHKSRSNPKWTDPEIEQYDKENGCTKGIFTVPSKWMKDICTNHQGKILCWKCGSKLGSFNWITGCECSCRAVICPAFYIIPSKVDNL